MDELYRNLAGLVDRGTAPGLVAAVAGAGGPVRVEVLGAAEFGADAPPMRRDTPFRLTSVTKPMVAAVAMMLVEDGLLTLDEPVDRLLPELAGPRVLRRLDADVDDTVPAHRAITVEDVLTHRLGHGLLLDPAADPPLNPPFPVVRAAEALHLTLARPDPRTPHGVDEWMRRFGTLPLLFQPGERWAYNCSALVLGVLAARAVRMGWVTCCGSGCSTRSAWPRPASRCHRPGPGSCRRTTSVANGRRTWRPPRTGRDSPRSPTPRPGSHPLWTTWWRSAGSCSTVDGRCCRSGRCGR